MLLPKTLWFRESRLRPNPPWGPSENSVWALVHNMKKTMMFCNSHKFGVLFSQALMALHTHITHMHKCIHTHVQIQMHTCVTQMHFSHTVTVPRSPSVVSTNNHWVNNHLLSHSELPALLPPCQTCPFPRWPRQPPNWSPYLWAALYTSDLVVFGNADWSHQSALTPHKGQTSQLWKQCLPSIWDFIWSALRQPLLNAPSPQTSSYLNLTHVHT